jgi:hypothetical protein
VTGRALRGQVAAYLRLGMWGVDTREPHAAALALGDLALTYIGPPERAFVGRVEIGSSVRDWTPAEAKAYQGDARGGVLLTDVEDWDPASAH